MRNRSVLLALGLMTLAAQSQAGLLYSFETGTEGWYNPSWSGGDVTFTQDTVGVTDGSHSARVNYPAGAGFRWLMVDNVSGAKAADLMLATQLMIDMYLPVDFQDGWFNGKAFMQEMFGGWNWREVDQITYGPGNGGNAGQRTVTFNISSLTSVMVAGQPYRLGFSINANNAQNRVFYLDNIRTDTPVPEPATFVAFAIGGLALLRRKR